MEFNHKKYGKIKIKEESLDDGYIKITLIMESKKEEIGYVSFKITTERNRVAWLQKIEVQEKYQSQKFGDNLISLFEDAVKRKDCDVVEGKFWPTNEHAKPFYEKHGYEIFKEGYDTYIYKRGLTKDKTSTMAP